MKSSRWGRVGERFGFFRRWRLFAKRKSIAENVRLTFVTEQRSREKAERLAKIVADELDVDAKIAVEKREKTATNNTFRVVLHFQCSTDDASRAALDATDRIGAPWVAFYDREARRVKSLVFDKKNGCARIRRKEFNVVVWASWEFVEPNSCDS